MRTLIMLVCGLLLALALPGLAQKPKNDSALKGDFALLPKVCKFTTEQQTKLEETVKATKAALKAWDAQNQEKVDKIEADMKVAREAKDKATLKTLRKQQEELLSGRTAIEAQSHKDIMGLLTPEQKTTWAVFTLDREVTRPYAKMKLTDEQRAKITPLCAAAVTDLQKLPPEDLKARAKVKKALIATIEKDILTDAQRAALAAPKPKDNPKPKDRPK